MDSQSIFREIQGMNQMPDFKQQIVSAYDQPVLRPLVDERANLESQYMPSVFQPFVDSGTTAADMSPAAKLAAIGGSLGRLTSRIGANQDIQNFYGTQMDNLAGTMANTWQQRLQNLKDQFQMAMAKEEADRAERARQAQMANLAGLFGGNGVVQPMPSAQDYALQKAREAVAKAQGLKNTQINTTDDNSLSGQLGKVFNLLQAANPFNAIGTMGTTLGTGARNAITRNNTQISNLSLDTLNKNRAGAGLAPMEQSQYQKSYLPTVAGFYK